MALPAKVGLSVGDKDQDNDHQARERKGDYTDSRRNAVVLALFEQNVCHHEAHEVRATPRPWEKVNVGHDIGASFGRNLHRLAETKAVKERVRNQVELDRSDHIGDDRSNEQED